MVRMILVIVLIAAVVAGIGFYRGWFHFSSDSGSNNAKVTVSVDKDKIEEDKDKAVDKMQDLGKQAEDKVTPSSQ
jgi:hypothetical protein